MIAASITDHLNFIRKGAYVIFVNDDYHTYGSFGSIERANTIVHIYCNVIIT